MDAEFLIFVVVGFVAQLIDGALGMAFGVVSATVLLFAGWLDVVDKPIRVFHGAVDDYIPAAGYRSYVDQLQKAGKDATFTEYADAHHVFDWPAFKNPLKLPQAQTTETSSPAKWSMLRFSF